MSWRCCRGGWWARRAKADLRPRTARAPARRVCALRPTARSAAGRPCRAEDLEQARLAGAVAPHQADLVSRGDGEARVRQHAARGDVDGKVADLQHEARHYGTVTWLRA